MTGKNGKPRTPIRAPLKETKPKALSRAEFIGAMERIDENTVVFMQLLEELKNRILILEQRLDGDGPSGLILP